MPPPDQSTWLAASAWFACAPVASVSTSTSKPCLAKMPCFTPTMNAACEPVVRMPNLTLTGAASPACANGADRNRAASATLSQRMDRMGFLLGRTVQLGADAVFWLGSKRGGNATLGSVDEPAEIGAGFPGIDDVLDGKGFRGPERRGLGAQLGLEFLLARLWVGRALDVATIGSGNPALDR